MSGKPTGIVESIRPVSARRDGNRSGWSRRRCHGGVPPVELLAADGPKQTGRASGENDPDRVELEEIDGNEHGRAKRKREAVGRMAPAARKKNGQAEHEHEVQDHAD